MNAPPSPRTLDMQMTEQGVWGQETFDVSYGAVSGKIRDDKHGYQYDALSVFPEFFTVLCTLLFGCPMYQLWSTVTLPEVTYWINGAFLPYLIPVVIIAAHWQHLRTGLPNRAAVVGSLVLPPIILMFYSILVPYGKGSGLFSTDCESDPRKAKLQKSWLHANALFENCLNKTSQSSGHPVDALQAKFRVQDCSGYTRALSEYGVDWAYLQYLETAHKCSGWCYAAPPLWGYTENKDDCSTLVGAIFRYKVDPYVDEVFHLTLFTLLFSAVSMVLVGPIMRKNGIPW